MKEVRPPDPPSFALASMASWSTSKSGSCRGWIREGHQPLHSRSRPHVPLGGAHRSVSQSVGRSVGYLARRGVTTPSHPFREPRPFQVRIEDVVTSVLEWQGVPPNWLRSSQGSSPLSGFLDLRAPGKFSLERFSGLDILPTAKAGGFLGALSGCESMAGMGISVEGGDTPGASLSRRSQRLSGQRTLRDAQDTANRRALASPVKPVELPEADPRAGLDAELARTWRNALAWVRKLQEMAGAGDDVARANLAHVVRALEAIEKGVVVPWPQVVGELLQGDVVTSPRGITSVDQRRPIADRERRRQARAERKEIEELRSQVSAVTQGDAVPQTECIDFF